ncbi:NAD(+) diphosphatase [Thalassomonas actiniarum]|uniref:NAD(+) diphosphatase n=1 Tax=Thalassomonas actiniarum TaxID=485447 RepID=A0AAE9YNY0_9GAMM|nr:NAD(+) diphosphatase [Thalassomonas actiniarum]WDD97813.1 NAD(+) diphosphatase [Thalassomonas actiniarum]
MNSPALTFSQMSLNRASSARKSKHWLLEQQNKADTVFLPVWRSLCLFEQDKLAEFTREQAITGQLISQASNCYFLGLDGEQAVFVLDLSELSQKLLDNLLTDKYQAKDFRSALPLITARQAPILAYGRALNHWHRQCQYCGYCGGKTLSLDGGHRRKCQSESCAKEHFPRTDPVVIMLVEYQPPGGKAKCLLAQHHNIPSKVVSTLAGFVDPGESLEEAVSREVFEEAGVVVDQVTYMASQPWPFPNSLMIGFFARATSDEINIDNDEIVDACWFSAEEISTFDNWGDAGDNYQLPRKESIARYLIDSWLEKQAEKQ